MNQKTFTVNTMRYQWSEATETYEPVAERFENIKTIYGLNEPPIIQMLEDGSLYVIVSSGEAPFRGATMDALCIGLQ